MVIGERLCGYRGEVVSQELVSRSQMLMKKILQQPQTLQPPIGELNTEQAPPTSTVGR